MAGRLGWGVALVFATCTVFSGQDFGVVAAAAGSANECLRSSASDEEYKACMGELGLLQGQKNACQDGVDGELIAAAMGRGFYESVLDLIQACADRGVKIDTSVHQKVNSLRKKISEVAARLQSANAGQSTVAPAFEWAQSADNVYIGVKFAHKLDAPACIDLVDEQLSIESSRLSLNATCKGKNKRFSLTIDLHEEIDTEKSSWSMASVGRGTFSLVKAQSQTRWQGLLKGPDRPRNMHTWYFMFDKYKAELEEIDRAKEAADKAAKAETDEKTREEQEEKREHDSQASPEDEKSAAEIEREKSAKELRKRAKQDSKRVIKESKKAIKELDKNLKQRVKELVDEHEKEKKSLEDDFSERKQKLVQDKKDKVAKIEETLEKAIKDLDSPQGASGLYEQMVGMLFGSDDEESPTQGEKTPGHPSESSKQEL